MVKIRLMRFGKKNSPAYRIVVCDSHVKSTGKHLEEIGYFNPSEAKKPFSIDKARYEEWIKLGANPSEAVLKLLSGDYKYKKYEPKSKQKAEGEKPKANQEENATTKGGETTI